MVDDSLSEHTRSSSVLRPCQHNIGYMGDDLYRSKDPTNSIKVLTEMLQNTNQTTKRTENTYAQRTYHQYRHRPIGHPFPKNGVVKNYSS